MHVSEHRLYLACQGKVVDACLEYGARLSSDGPNPGARGAFESACDLGSGRGCLRAGAMQPDSKLSASLYERGCQAGDVSACAETGALKAKQGDPEGGLPALTKACGAVIQEGKDAPALPDPIDAKGRLAACDALARRRAESADATAADLSAATCALQSQDGCTDLGTLLLEGKLIPADPVRARGLLERACTAKVGQACAILARIFKDGLGAPVDLRRARELLDLGCTKLRSDQACDARRAFVVWLRGPFGRSGSGSLFREPGELFEASAGVLSAPSPAALACRVTSAVERSFKVAYRFGLLDPPAEGLGSNSAATFLVPGADLEAGDGFQVSAFTVSTGYSVGNALFVAPTLPGFGDRRELVTHRFQGELDGRFPLRLQDERGTLECRAVAPKDLDLQAAPKRAALATFGKRMQKPPRPTLDAADFGLEAAGVPDFERELGTLARLLSWRHPEVRSRLAELEAFDARWFEALARLGPTLRARTPAVARYGDVTFQVVRASCNPADGAVYRARLGARCALELEVKNLRGQEQHLASLEIQDAKALGSDGRLWRLEQRLLLKPDGTWSEELSFARLPPSGTATLVVSPVDNSRFQGASQPAPPEAFFAIQWPRDRSLSIRWPQVRVKVPEPAAPK